MLGLDLRPSAERVDGHELELGEAVDVGRIGGTGIPRAEVVLQRDRLALRAVEVVEVGLRRRALLVGGDVARDQRDRRLGDDRDRGQHDVELVLAEFVQRQERLVLPRQQHIADAALREGRRRAARAGVEHRHVGEERAHVVADLVLVAAELLVGPGPGREVVPAGAARGLRVRRDHLDVILDQVVPVLDFLGIAFPHEEHDRRGVGRRVARQLRLPVRRDLAGLLGDGIDVAGERQGDDLGLEPVDHRARLRAGAAVRGLDRQFRVTLGLPVGVERLR